MKKFRKRVLCAAILVMAASRLFASSLPDGLGEWRLISESVTELVTADNLGRWTSAAYTRKAPPGRIDVQLTEGPGPGSLIIPDEAEGSGGLPELLDTAEYETLTVADRQAVLESDALLGLAAAVQLDERTVTFEAKGLSREELLAFAENMIRNMTGVLAK